MAYCEVIIRFSHVVSDDSPKGKAVHFFKNDLEKSSSGEIKILIYPQGILFDDIPVLEALKTDVVQMAAPSFSKFSGRIKDFQVFDIPYLFKNIDDVHNFYESEPVKILSREAEKIGIKIIAFWDNDFKHVTCSSKPIKYPTDMKNMKVRSMGSPIINKQFSIMGGKAFTYPFNSLKNLLSEKIVDCQENTFNNIYSQKLHLYQNFLTISSHGYLGYAVVISKKFWDHLPDRYRTMILNSMNNATEYERKISMENNAQDLFRLKKSKLINIYELSAREKDEWENFFKLRYPLFISLLSDKMREELKKMGMI
ncbi:MAG: DctP family TRAP transporter solute-binding subunit [Calditerrivibrio sp.]|nr:DctP family TRAP transporter solute-binding subunit [Calditerrivibrio sp.]MCA1932963.1 DctP family TRAP transporter solute-binding subunit [Calditerrivibrio sp.]